MSTNDDAARAHEEVQREWTKLLHIVAAAETPHDRDWAWRKAVEWILVNTFGDGDIVRYHTDPRFHAMVQIATDATVMLHEAEKHLRNSKRPALEHEEMQRLLLDESLRELFENGEPRI